MRRVWCLSAIIVAAAASTASQSQLTPQTEQSPQTTSGPQNPIFRSGTNRVQVDVIVTGDDGRPITDLMRGDFDVLDDGRSVPVESARFLGAETANGDSTLAPIRTLEDEEREASRDDIHVYAIFLDDYHVRRMGELRVIEALTAFVRELPAIDLVAVYYPLDSMTDVHFARNREPVFKAIRDFKGRLGEYQPLRPAEEEHLKYPRDIERIRRQITASALEGLVTHLGAIKQGRKTLLLVSEGFVVPVADLEDVYRAANRSNVAVYPVDPRGMTGSDRGTTPGQMMNLTVGDRDMLRELAQETGGRAIVYRNDLQGEIHRIIRDASAYYLLSYESPHPDDNRFHRVTVRVKRPRLTVFARTGYWSMKGGQGLEHRSSLAPVVPPAVQDAVNRLADSLRPNADEPAEPARRITMPAPAVSSPSLLVSPPALALVRGRSVGEPVSRREFRRADTIVARAATSGTPTVTARLLAHDGQRLADLPVTLLSDVCEVRLALPNFAPGDYVLAFSATTPAGSAEQYVAFRVLR